MRTQVQDVIDSIRPAVQADGADISLLDVAEGSGVVTVELTVPGHGCAGSPSPLLAGVERIVRDRVPGVTAVVRTCTDDDAGCDHGGGACGHHGLSA